MYAGSHLQSLVAAEAAHGARAICRKADGQVHHAWPPASLSFSQPSSSMTGSEQPWL